MPGKLDLSFVLFGYSDCGRTLLASRIFKDEVNKRRLAIVCNFVDEEFPLGLNLSILDVDRIGKDESNPSILFPMNFESAIFYIDSTCPQEFLQIDEWLKVLENSPKTCDCHIFGCNSDLKSEDEEIREYAKNLNMKYISTSSKNDTGIRKLFGKFITYFLGEIPTEMSDMPVLKKALNENKFAALKEFEDKWKEIFSKLENERKLLREKIENCFQDELEISLNDSNLQHGIEIISTYIFPVLKFQRQDIEDKLIHKCLDYMYCERIYYLEKFSKKTSIFIQFFQDDSSDKGFAMFNLNEDILEDLKYILAEFAFVRSLMFHKCRLDVEWESFWLGLRKSKGYLKTLIFSNCDITLEPSIFGLVVSKLKLEYFSFNESKITCPKSVGGIFKYLRNSASTLTTINLVRCGLTKDDCEIIGNIFENCYSISKINLQGNDRMEDGFCLICNRLRGSAKCLTDINFSDCNLREDHQLISLLKECKSLKQVYLRDNPNIKSTLSEFSESLTNVEFHFEKL